MKKEPNEYNKITTPGVLMLTPECQNLWLLSPKSLFLYEKIVIDEQDLSGILHPKKDTRFGAMKARIAQNLLDWGYLQPVSYRDHLSLDARKNVKKIAEDIVEQSLPKKGEGFKDSKFYKLSVYTHQKFAAYLEDSIIACPSQDEAELKKYVNRLNAVESRLHRLSLMDIDDKLCEELSWTIERIAAKAIAGIALSRKIGLERLYDTDEYLPFIQEIKVNKADNFVVFAPEQNIPTLSASVAALSNKSLPDITIADDYKLFSSIRNKNEFTRLRAILRDFENLFGQLIEEHSDLVRKKIAMEVERLNLEFTERLEEAKISLGNQTKWVTIEMLAGQIAGFLSPWIGIAKESSKMEKIKKIRAEFLSRQDLAGNIFFMMDVWMRHKILDDERYRKKIKTTDNSVIWGQNISSSNYPWYEQDS